MQIGSAVEGLNCKKPIPICRLFLKTDLLTDIAALCLTDFVDWRYIHSLVGIFDPACELLPPWTKELYLCTVAPLSSLWPPPPPPQTKCTVYTDSVCLRHGGRWSSHTAQIFLTRPSVSSCVRHGCNPLERFSSEWGHLSEQGSVIRGLTILHLGNYL